MISTVPQRWSRSSESTRSPHASVSVGTLCPVPGTHDELYVPIDRIVSITCLPTHYSLPAYLQRSSIGTAPTLRAHSTLLIHHPISKHGTTTIAYLPHTHPSLIPSGLLTYFPNTSNGTRATSTEESPTPRGVKFVHIHSESPWKHNMIITLTPVTPQQPYRIARRARSYSRDGRFNTPHPGTQVARSWVDRLPRHSLKHARVSR